MLPFSSHPGLPRFLREFLDHENTRVFGLFDSFANLFDHFVGQIALFPFLASAADLD
ncbi:MAG: hypothetical protein WAM90_05265 [Rhodanobacter sp.]